jgi:hypothetical protein
MKDDRTRLVDEIRIMITITREEKRALIDLAQLRRRDPRDQAAQLVHDGLISYGMLTWRPLASEPGDQENAGDGA